MAYRKNLSREKVLDFLGRRGVGWRWKRAVAPNYWGREVMTLGHEVRLVAPIYVKPFVKRHKNDAADAEAIRLSIRQLRSL